MTDFIKKLEKEFNTQIIRSNKHIRGENHYDLDEDGNVKTLDLDEIDLKNLEVLLPIANSLVNLTVTRCNIRTLELLKSFPQLEALDLCLNSLNGSTLRHLSHLKNLKKLDLSATNLKDTSPLGSLTNLEMLFIGSNDHLNEVKGLESLTSLHHLDLAYNQIDSIEKINVNANLCSLNISGSEINKITHLERFPNLEKLNIEGSLVEKIEGLGALKNLKELFISGRIKRIEGLENLTKLEVLDLHDNQISKIEGLDHLTGLKWLNLNENGIIKVENLDHLINLELLLLEANRDVIYFDTSFFNNLVSECQIYIHCIDDLDRIEAMAPKNVKINFDKNFPYPISLYDLKYFFQ